MGRVSFRKDFWCCYWGRAGYPGYQRFFSRAVGIFGVGRRPTHLRPKTWQKPETALEKSLASRVRAGQLLVNFPPVPSNSPKSLCESQLGPVPFSFLKWRITQFAWDLACLALPFFPSSLSPIPYPSWRLLCRLLGTVRKGTLAAFISYVDAEMPQ